MSEVERANPAGNGTPTRSFSKYVKGHSFIPSNYKDIKTSIEDTDSDPDVDEFVSPRIPQQIPLEPNIPYIFPLFRHYISKVTYAERKRNGNTKISSVWTICEPDVIERLMTRGDKRDWTYTDFFPHASHFDDRDILRGLTFKKAQSIACMLHATKQKVRNRSARVEPKIGKGKIPRPGRPRTKPEKQKKKKPYQTREQLEPPINMRKATNLNTDKPDDTPSSPPPMRSAHVYHGVEEEYQYSIFGYSGYIPPQYRNRAEKRVQTKALKQTKKTPPLPPPITKVKLPKEETGDNSKEHGKDDITKRMITEIEEISEPEIDPMSSEDSEGEE
jgi:hypothetical protein